MLVYKKNVVICSQVSMAVNAGAICKGIEIWTMRNPGEVIVNSNCCQATSHELRTTYSEQPVVIQGVLSL